MSKPKLLQIEWLKKIVNIQANNPECDIVFIINNNKFMVEDVNYNSQEIYKIKVDFVYNDGEMVYIGKDDIKEAFWFEFEGCKLFKNGDCMGGECTDICKECDEYNKIIDKRFIKEVKRKIIVFFK